ncbi:hypothetical protein GSbR_27770 [Geobacter sp. SVR]|nr:hypothetical protein GSVR_23500 [Geobacter sp. SVR]GCF86177.1 hypothetical protein GSbR_27770 [Geobacter sp. SVR]
MVDADDLRALFMKPAQKSKILPLIENKILCRSARSVFYRVNPVLIIYKPAGLEFRTLLGDSFKLVEYIF